jgi:filamentous hemagglutinin family protein
LHKAAAIVLAAFRLARRFTPPQDAAMRRLLLATTALLWPAWAAAQSPGARPEGGRVVAGAASIRQDAARTQVIQSTDRAVIEWRGFDIGAAHQVEIRQPATTSWSLQRVTGPDPSAIAGRLTSNGGVAIVNRAGVVFHQGAQVDVAGLIASAADTTNQNFMAGRMAFDGAPRPGARVENRGRITVREQGLAALVGPVAANSGTIAARLGRVAIAGGEAVTLDLAGDGLLSLDVTGTGLARNAGTIAAEGGQVLLTARAASDVIEHVVEAGGRIAADRIAARGESVLVPVGAVLDAPGGRVAIQAERRAEMRGTIRAPGGEVAVSARRALAVDGRIEAARIVVDPEELRVVAALSGGIEPAEITAATINGSAGALTLQAERTIRVEAAIAKPAGALTLETTNPTALPGEGIFLNATVNVAGALTLRSAGEIAQASAGARLTAGRLFAESAGGAVRLDAGGNVIRAIAGGGAAGRFGLATTVNLPVEGAIAAEHIALITSQQILLRAPLTAGRTVTLEAARGIAQAGGLIATPRLDLEAPLGTVALGAANRIGALGDVLVPFGLSLRNGQGLVIAGQVNGAGASVALTVDAGDLTQTAAGGRLIADRATLRAALGSVLLDGPLNAVARAEGSARDAFLLDAGRALTLSGPVAAERIGLTARGDLAQETDALLITPALSARSIGGSVRFEDPLNRVSGLGDSGADLVFALSTATDVALRGVLAAPEVSLIAGGTIAQAGGAIRADLLRLNAFTGDVALDGPGHRVAALLPSGAAGGFAFTTEGALAVAGALDAGGALALTAASLSLSAPIVAPSVALRAAGDILQAGGRIATASLIAEGAEVRLDAAGNAIAAVAGRGTSFRLASATALALGDLAAPEIGLAAGDVTQTAPIATDLLEIASAGSVRLDAANAIAALGALTAPRGLTLRTTGALAFTAPLDLPEARFVTGGELTQTPFARLAIGRLALDLGGAARLDQAGNAIPLLGASDVAGDLLLTTGGSLDLAGTVRTLGTLALTASGDLVQSAGFLQAPVLQARAIGGSVVLEGANLLGAASGFAAGSWRLADAGLGTLRLVGLLAAPEVSLRLAGGLAETTGGLRTAALALDVAGAVALDGPSHLVGAVAGRAGALRLAAGGPLQVAGALAVGGALALQGDSLALLAPVAAGQALLVAPGGGIAQAPNAPLALGGALQVFAAGDVALAASGNAIPLVTAATAGGDLALATEGALRATGSVVGETVTLRAGGPLTLDGAAFQAGRAVLVAAPAGLEAGARSTLEALDPTRLPLLILDVRGAPLANIPPGLAPDQPGLPAAAQPTQLAAFGPATALPSAGAAFDLAVGASPVFLLLDGGPAVGTLEAGRLGLVGRGGSAFLVGALGGVGGEAAAGLVALAGAEPGYRFNGCPMGLANCGAAPPAPGGQGPAAPGAAARAARGDFAPERLGDTAPWSPWPVPWPLPEMVAMAGEED